MKPQQQSLIGTSEAMQPVIADIESSARSGAKVLITGETGVGKEVVARTVHQKSARQAAAFVTINCAGVPDSLLESELFGHARGSFTGAVRDNPGLLRQANGGTVFLDEVGEMSLRMQALLLRFLETGEIQTIGAATASAKIDVRVITATNRNLLEAANAREFREDLYYRLNVFEIRVPPLRERPSDIPVLLEYYLQWFGEHHRHGPLAVSKAALDRLTSYGWPGNVRELRNVVERLVLRVEGPTIEPDALPVEIASHVPAARDQGPSHARESVSDQARVDALIERLRQKESF